jgi:hypothetical protein
MFSHLKTIQLSTLKHSCIVKAFGKNAVFHQGISIKGILIMFIFSFVREDNMLPALLQFDGRRNRGLTT